MQAPTSSETRQPSRTVLFMTAPCVSDIPVNGPQPACLLPFGCASFAEQVLDSCARAGLKVIDLVVSEQPEALRQLLGDGWRWGLQLNWHLAKESATPYSLLHTLGLAPGQRVLIGHGHRWVADGVVRSLAETDRVAVRAGQAIAWTGWVSMDSLFLNAISPHADYDTLAEIALSLHARPCVLVQRREFAWSGTALALLQAQELALGDETGVHVPATWLRRPWGAMSPDASVHPQADMRGPVLVGPRCMVERDAHVGPGTVLSRDVLISGDAVVRDALVLPDSYVSGSVTLDHAVVRGNTVQDLKWSARTTLPEADGLLGTLEPKTPPRAAWAGRLAAGGLALALAPVFVALGLVQTLRGQAFGWRCVDAVTGRSEETDRLQRTRLRAEPPQAGLVGTLQGRWGALLDVAQGRRHWFGIRLRDEAQWYALRRDWQLLFSDQPVGFFHAPSWMEREGHPDGEALAAADAYFTVRASWRERLRTLLLLAQNFRVAETRS